MTTTKLIELLKEADPDGTAHVRIPGGTIFNVELKEGYWDGPYSYVEDGKFIISTKEFKVDIIPHDYDDWIYDHEGKFDDIKIEFTYLDGGKREQEYRDKFREISEEYGRVMKQLNQESLETLLALLKKGAKIYQKKGSKIGNYSDIYVHSGILKPDEHLTIGQFKVLTKSGYFKPVDKRNVIHWEIDV